MSVPVRKISLQEFLLSQGLMSGEIHVSERLPGRKGARAGNRPRGTESRTSPAGPGDGSGPTDGGSAITSDARSADRKTDAGPADGQGEEPKRALIPGKEQWAPAMKFPLSQIQAIKMLSAGRWEFVREVNDGVDLTAVTRKLLADSDSKVQLRTLERLLDILDSVDWKDMRVIEQRAGSGSGWNIPRPERD